MYSLFFDIRVCCENLHVKTLLFKISLTVFNLFLFVLVLFVYLLFGCKLQKRIHSFNNNNDFRRCINRCDAFDLHFTCKHERKAIRKLSAPKACSCTIYFALTGLWIIRIML